MAPEDRNTAYNAIESRMGSKIQITLEPKPSKPAPASAHEAKEKKEEKQLESLQPVSMR